MPHLWYSTLVLCGQVPSTPDPTELMQRFGWLQGLFSFVIIILLVLIVAVSWFDRRVALKREEEALRREEQWKNTTESLNAYIRDDLSRIILDNTTAMNNLTTAVQHLSKHE